MGLFSRLKTGFALARGSVRVLRDHPRLLVFPVFGGVAGSVYLVLLFGVAFAGGAPGSGAGTYAVLFVFYLGSTFLASFFTAALMYCTRQAFEGEEPSVGAGLRAAARNAGPLFAWAVVAAVVGVVLRAIEGSDTPLAQIAAALFSVAWSVLTYFVVPVVVFEDVGLREMFSRSKETVVETWGESLGAVSGVGLVTVVFALVGVLVGAALFVFLPGVSSLVGLGVAVAAVLFAVLLGQALTGVAKTALYVYATAEESPAYFSDVDFGGGATSGDRSGRLPGSGGVV